MKIEGNGLVDYGRFVAAIGMVWFHSAIPGGNIAYAALPFLLVALSLPVSSSPVDTGRSLLVPFLAWSLVYALLNVILSVKDGVGPFDWWQWHMLLSGTWPHLWILPFAFLAAALSPWFHHPLASFGAAFLVTIMLSAKGTPETAPFMQWSFGIIPLLVAIAYLSWGWKFATVTLLSSFLILHFGRPSPDNITILAGTALALATLSLRLPKTETSDWCGRLALTIYLAHPLVLVLGQTLRITWVELALFALAGSLILAQVLDSAFRSARETQPDY